MRVYYDTETCGFHGQPVIVQYAEGDNAPVIHNFWTRPSQESKDLIARLLNADLLVGFNLAFDHFQLQKMYTLLDELGDCIPITVSKTRLYEAEVASRDGKFLKPKKVLDLMLHAQKGPYQKCMERKPLVVRRVPVQAATALCDLLNQTVNFADDEILFGFKPGERWKVYDAKDHRGNILEGLKELRLSFNPSMSLKNICVDLGIVDEAVKFKDIMPDEMPLELGFAPFAAAFDNIKTDSQRSIADALFSRKFGEVYKKKLLLPYKGTWLDYIDDHVDFWENNQPAREYAINDPIFTRELDKHFGFPEGGDDDSELACCVATCRWRGYSIDKEGLKSLIPHCQEREEKFPEHSSSTKSLRYVAELMNSIEKDMVGNKGDKVVLEKLANSGSPAGQRARVVLDARHAKKEMELIDKLLIAGRFHASFKVIGTLSSRMSGADNLNPQGIKRDKSFRAMFPLASKGYQLMGGDFSGFEVCIFEAVSNDAKLREDLLSGKKIHGIFGTFVYPHMTYEEILLTEGKELDLYTRSKSALFAMLYGGEAQTLMERLGVSEEDAKSAYDSFLEAYPGARRERLSIKERFSPIKQDSEGKVSWGRFENCVTSLYGFNRYFDLEFRAAKELYDLSNNLPDSWKKANILVKRNVEGPPQKIGGAIMSALYGAAFNIQGQVFRQAANHRIQSTGAQITKLLERRLWDLQPVGIHECYVQPMNIHDEVMCPAKPELKDKVSEVVETLLREIEPVIPLVKIAWSNELESWAGKGT